MPVDRAVRNPAHTLLFCASTTCSPYVVIAHGSAQRDATVLMPASTSVARAPARLKECPDCFDAFRIKQDRMAMKMTTTGEWKYRGQQSTAR